MQRSPKVDSPRRILLLGLVAALAAPRRLLAQATAHRPRVAILYSSGTPKDNEPLRDVFAQAMRANGYTVGKDLVLEERFAGNQIDRLAPLIRELLDQKPAVILVVGSRAVHEAKSATTSVPIVMIAAGDPVGQGLVASLARPGGNITGNAVLTEVLVPKRLELLLEIIPKAKRIGFLSNPSSPATPMVLVPLLAAAKKRGVEVVQFNASNERELDDALQAITLPRVDALITGADVLFYTLRGKIAESLTGNRVPGVYGWGEAVLDGGMISYAPSVEELFRDGARFAARILKGAKPGTLPIEQPTRMELFVNLKTARALGVSIPRSVLLRADKVIE